MRHSFLLPLTTVALAALPMHAQEQQPASLNDLVLEWSKKVQARQDQARQWEQDKQVLLDTKSAYETEAQQIELLMGSIHSVINAQVESQIERAAEKVEYDNSLRELNGKVLALSGRALALRGLFPPAEEGALEASFDQLTEMKRSDAKGQRDNVAKSLASIVTVLKQAAKFQSKLNYYNQELELEGKTLQIETLYFGFAQAYAVDEEGTKAYHGTVKDGAWAWQPIHGKAADVRVMFDMQNGSEAEALFIKVPVQVK